MNNLPNTITVKKTTMLEAIIGITSASHDNPQLICLAESLFGDVVREGGYNDMWTFCQAMAIEDELGGQFGDIQHN
jgi:hypothetical protein